MREWVGAASGLRILKLAPILICRVSFNFFFLMPLLCLCLASSIIFLFGGGGMGDTYFLFYLLKVFV